MKNRLWITGYRSFELNIFKDDDPKIKVIKRAIQDTLINKLENNDLVWVITGGQLGVEQWSAEVALKLKRKHFQIKLAVILPFKDFGKRWNKEHKEKLSLIIKKADFSALASHKNYYSPFQFKDYQKFLFRHTDGTLMVYDPDHRGKSNYDYRFIKIQQKRYPRYDFNLINFDYLEDLAQDIKEEKYPW